jgi:APA family basic amino acid/polyamine antiporter
MTVPPVAPSAPGLAGERPAGAASGAQLLRVMGVAFGIAVGIGSVIGAGILRAPGEIAARLPTPWLFITVWIVGGMYALLGANSMTELGTMLPRSGGQYVYARHTFGAYAGFVVGWNDWVSSCGSVAAISIVVGESLAALVPALATHAVSISVVVLLVVTAVLWRGARASDLAQQVTSLVKAVALLTLVAACFVIGGRFPVEGARAPSIPVPSGTALVAAFVIALQGVIYSYDGWTAVLYFSEEVRDPGREIPRSLFGGLLGVLAIYLLINVAFLHVLPMSAMASSTMVAATAATSVFGAYGDRVVRAIVVLALPSAVTANLLMASRIAFSMARDGLTTRAATRVSATGTPTVALLLSSACTFLFVLTGTFDVVIAMVAFLFVATYAISFTAVVVLRHREPDAPRPYRALGYPWTTGLVLAGSFAFLVAALLSDTRNSVIALLLVVASYPVYRLVHRAA